MTYKIRIGLDIGIASAGWCVMICDDNGEPIRIEALGSRIFGKIEETKTGAALAEVRRTARGARRCLRRKRARLDGIVSLFAKNGVDIEFKGKDVNFLRAYALDNKISENDFARVLYLIAKRRGFKSNSKSVDASDKEGGKVITATRENKRVLEENNYRTVGEMIYNRYKSEIETRAGKTITVIKSRNRGGEYDKAVLRSELGNEIRVLFEKQREFGNDLASESVETEYLAIFDKQRNFDDGPGEGSPYSAEYKVGWCPFEKAEHRAPKSSYSFEYSTALQKLNNVSVIGDAGQRNLGVEERETILKLIKSTEKVSYYDLRQALKNSIDDTDRFNISYSVARKRSKKAKEDEKPKSESAIAYEVEKKTKLSSMKHSCEIASKLSEEHSQDTNLIDQIALVLSMAKSDDKRRLALADNSVTSVLSEEERENLLPLICDKFGLLSFTALRKLIPYLEDGLKYANACEAAGYKISTIDGEKTKFLNTSEIYQEVGEITSPIVKRSVSQTLKLLNAIIAKYGSPVAVNVELARDMSKSTEERRKIESINKANLEDKERARNEFRNKFGREATGDNIFRYRLYEEQNGQCVYSGKQIDLERMFDNNFYQVDHIMPYSRTFNDSYNNKVLVSTDENQRKGNRLPYEYMNQESFERFVQRVNANVNYIRNPKKKANLLRTTLNEDEMKSRALNDTRYISRFVSELLARHLLFDTTALNKKRVFVYNGAMTDYVRRQWGIKKIREDGDLHHAVDAAVIACMTDGMRQKIESYHKTKEVKWIGNKQFDAVTGEEVATMNVVTKDERLPLPYEGFRAELKARTEDNIEDMRRDLVVVGYTEEQLNQVEVPFVSRMPKRKIKGQLHDATVRSSKILDTKGIVISKTALGKLKLSKDKSEIEGYFDKNSDRLLYDKLYGLLLAHDGNAEKAFAQPVYKPRSDGSDGNIVRSVKTCQKSTDGVRLDKVKGIAANGSMARVDVYQRNEDYYGVPVYVIDAYKNTLPIKAVVAGKPKSEWIEMKEEEFLFSLYQNDLVEVEHKKGITMSKQRQDDDSRMPKDITFKKCLGYFVSFGISTGSIKLVDNTNCYAIPSLGIKTLKSLRKCQVDVLGNVSYVCKEKLVPLTMKNPGVSGNNKKI